MGNLQLSSFLCSSCKKECLAELLGTYSLVLIGPASVIIASLIPSMIGVVALTFIALVFGGTVASLVFLLGKYSGAVINPAITLSIGLNKLIRSRLLIPYLFFQIVGGLLAGFTLRILFGSVDLTKSLGSTKLASGINPILGIAIETIGTFILASSALIASTKIKAARNQALFVGTTLFVLILFIGPLTGAGFNPARSLGPALASGYIENLYVYFIGPILGALLAGILFKVIHGGRRRNPVCLC